MSTGKAQKSTVLGAGVAEAACARPMTLGGVRAARVRQIPCTGTRLATRLAEWIDRHRQARMARVDHGAVRITARRLGA
jgi:predicted NAD/FAD-dependent oxidoreductase